MLRRTSQQKDHILRLIQAAAEAVRQLRERLAGGAAPDVVRREAAAAISALLGREASLLSQVDAASAVRLCGDVEQIEQWIELLEVEAEAADDPAVANARRSRAAALRAAVAALE